MYTAFFMFVNLRVVRSSFFLVSFIPLCAADAIFFSFVVASHFLVCARVFLLFFALEARRAKNYCYSIATVDEKKAGVCCANNTFSIRRRPKPILEYINKHTLIFNTAIYYFIVLHFFRSPLLNKHKHQQNNNDI